MDDICIENIFWKKSKNPYETCGVKNIEKNIFSVSDKFWSVWDFRAMRHDMRKSYHENHIPCNVVQIVYFNLIYMTHVVRFSHVVSHVFEDRIFFRHDFSKSARVSSDTKSCLRHHIFSCLRHEIFMSEMIFRVWSDTKKMGFRVWDTNIPVAVSETWDMNT